MAHEHCMSALRRGSILRLREFLTQLKFSIKTVLLFSFAFFILLLDLSFEAIEHMASYGRFCLSKGSQIANILAFPRKNFLYWIALLILVCQWLQEEGSIQNLAQQKFFEVTAEFETYSQLLVSICLSVIYSTIYAVT